MMTLYHYVCVQSLLHRYLAWQLPQKVTKYGLVVTRCAFGMNLKIAHVKRNRFLVNSFSKLSTSYI
jgi:hypothetical protein